MIHIVTGYMRSGTSAMMAALIAGGMSAAWNRQRDQFAERYGDKQYHPNRGGMYEIEPEEYSSVGFPSQYAGKLIKVMCWGMPTLTVHDYRIVMMRRDKEEIRQSYEGVFSERLQDLAFVQLDERLDDLEKQLRNRKDVRSVTVIDYRDLIHDPRKQLTRLYGWDFDVDAATKTIDPQQYRFRLERLTVGI